MIEQVGILVYYALASQNAVGYVYVSGFLDKYYGGIHF